MGVPAATATQSKEDTMAATITTVAEATEAALNVFATDDRISAVYLATGWPACPEVAVTRDGRVWDAAEYDARNGGR